MYLGTYWHQAVESYLQRHPYTYEQVELDHRHPYIISPPPPLSQNRPKYMIYYSYIYVVRD
jgi:hypothetical protein